MLKIACVQNETEFLFAVYLKANLECTDKTSLEGIKIVNLPFEAMLTHFEPKSI